MTDVNPYIGILILAVLTAGFLITMLVLATVLGPKNPTKTKQLPFECGSVSVGNVRDQRFNVRFYLVAMSFILFDIEVIFLYPWVVNIKPLGWTAFWAMMVFIVVISLGLVYEWRKGILDWKD
ncbi:MAG: NADH-quinone oxidoreductase subunit A [Bdellovibrionales bacterium]|nr:NADH-quinone oxidoreductase subunit A [Bdellovibrionales bacterium]